FAMLAIAQHAEVPGHAAVRLQDDARQDLLALLQPETLDVEVAHANSPGSVAWVLAVVGRDALSEALEEIADLARLGHRRVLRVARRGSRPPGVSRAGRQPRS